MIRLRTLYYTMIRVHDQLGNRRNSSPTLEVGVFLLKEDKHK